MEQENNYRRQIHIVGGGTIEPVRNHLALCAPAYGKVARQLAVMFEEANSDMDVNLHLTKMADPSSDIETSSHLYDLARDIVSDPASKVVIWSAAVSDFRGSIGNVESGKHAVRLDSRGEPPTMSLEPTPKIVPMFRRESVDGNPPRTDIIAVGFKTTTGATAEQQQRAGTALLERSELSLVLANDVITRNNMLITPEGDRLHETTNRGDVLAGLVDIILTNELLLERS